MPYEEEFDDVREDQNLISNSFSFTLPTTSEECEAKKAKTNESVKKYTSAQWTTLLMLAFGNFFCSSCSSLQGPLFPKEAEAKGATPTQYGLVLGIFDLTTFIAAPIIGKLMGHVQPKFFLNSGIFTIGVTNILFGTLDFAPSGRPFIALAFSIRIMEGLGTAALRTGSGALIAAQFRDKTSTAFGLLETFRGVGFIIGSTAGGALYDIGGYELPFFVMGSIVVVVAVIMLFLLPNPERTENAKADFMKFWLNPEILLFAFIIFTTYNFLGFNIATLEPHIREFNLSGVLIGLVFALCAVVYGLTSSFWGWLNDKKLGNKLLIFIGCSLMAVAEILIGPLPFFKTEPRLDLVIVGLFIAGLGMGGKLICSFGGALEDTLARGFPHDLNTYGLVAAMYISSDTLGAVVGPSIGGYLMEMLGYRMASVFLLAIEILLMVLITIHACTKKLRQSRKVDEEKKPLVAVKSQRQPSYS